MYNSTALLLVANALGISGGCWLLEGGATHQAIQEGASVFKFLW